MWDEPGAAGHDVRSDDELVARIGHETYLLEVLLGQIANSERIPQSRRTRCVAVKLQMRGMDAPEMVLVAHLAQVKLYSGHSIAQPYSEKDPNPGLNCTYTLLSPQRGHEWRLESRRVVHAHGFVLFHAEQPEALEEAVSWKPVSYAREDTLPIGDDEVSMNEVIAATLALPALQLSCMQLTTIAIRPRMFAGFVNNHIYRDRVNEEFQFYRRLRYYNDNLAGRRLLWCTALVWVGVVLCVAILVTLLALYLNGWNDNARLAQQTAAGYSAVLFLFVGTSYLASHAAALRGLFASSTLITCMQVAALLYSVTTGAKSLWHERETPLLSCAGICLGVFAQCSVAFPGMNISKRRLSHLLSLVLEFVILTSCVVAGLWLTNRPWSRGQGLIVVSIALPLYGLVFKLFLRARPRNALQPRSSWGALLTRSWDILGVSTFAALVAGAVWLGWHSGNRSVYTGVSWGLFLGLVVPLYMLILLAIARKVTSARERAFAIALMGLLIPLILWELKQVYPEGWFPHHRPDKYSLWHFGVLASLSWLGWICTAWLESSDRASVDSPSVSEQPQERSVAIEAAPTAPAMEGLTRPQKDELLALLLESPNLTDLLVRSQIIERLPRSIQNASPEGYNRRQPSLVALIDTCDRYPDGITELIDAVCFYEADSKLATRLQSWLRSVRPVGRSGTPGMLAGSMHFVILHGRGNDTDDVTALAALLRDAGHEVLTPDLPELRTDGVPPDPAVVATRLAALAPPGAVWVGNSYGGYVAAAACSQIAVSALVVLGVVARADVPTLALVGGNDMDTTDAESITGAGHLVQLDQPDAVAAHILCWLKSLDWYRSPVDYLSGGS